MARRVGRQEGRKEGDRCAAVDGQFLNANNGGVERGASRMKTREGGGMQIESCYRRLLRLRPNLRHLNMTREPTPFSRRGKCEFRVKRRAWWGAIKTS